MNTPIVKRITAVALLALLAGGATLAQGQQVQARVISTSPVTLPNGGIAYNVTYEYAGKQYQTRAANPPGASILVNVGDYGVATTSPVAPQPQIMPSGDPQMAQDPGQGAPQDWANVVPEPGVVVGTGAPPPVYAPGAPVYVQPAPVYYAPAPAVYPAYYPGYVAPYAYAPPIGISLGFGYTHGWGGGYGHWH